MSQLRKVTFSSSVHLLSGPTTTALLLSLQNVQRSTRMFLEGRSQFRPLTEMLSSVQRKKQSSMATSWQLTGLMPSVE